jgi:hypothetical protein
MTKREIELTQQIESYKAILKVLYVIIWITIILLINGGVEVLWENIFEQSRS